MNDTTNRPDRGGPQENDGTPRKRGTDRKDRLAEQLRANLQKRKAQTRSRRNGDTDKRPEGLGTSRQTPEN